MVDVTTSNESGSVAEAFIEMILADPDLLDEAFASVVASWGTRPPTGVREEAADRRSPAVRVPFLELCPGLSAMCPTWLSIWPVRTARSPPRERNFTRPPARGLLLRWRPPPVG